MYVHMHEVMYVHTPSLNFIMLSDHQEPIGRDSGSAYRSSAVYSTINVSRVVCHPSETAEINSQVIEQCMYEWTYYMYVCMYACMFT